MPGAPPKGHDGELATLNGAVVVAGLWNTEVTFSARATVEELWADLEIAGTPGHMSRWNIGSAYDLLTE